MKTRGSLIVLSGFAGVGKGTVLKSLFETQEGYAYSVSATTRQPRPGEVDGVHYFFVSKERFEEMIRDDELLEHASYVGNYYGTPRAYVEQKLDEGFDVILEIEVQGALQIMQRRPEAISVFIAAPSFEVLAARLRGRGDTEEEKVLLRLEQARTEYRVAAQYQYVIVNDRLEDAVDDLQAILRAEALKAEHQQHLLKEEL